MENYVPDLKPFLTASTASWITEQLELKIDTLKHNTVPKYVHCKKEMKTSGSAKSIYVCCTFNRGLFSKARDRTP